MSSDFQQCHSAIARDTTTTTLELSLIRVDARRAQALHDVRCNGLCASILSEQYQVSSTFPLVAYITYIPLRSISVHSPW